MNETSETKIIQRSLPVRFFHWLFSWRTVRRTLIALVGLITLIGLFITEENWRGKRAWENYQHEWEAKGEKFDWQSFVPPAVPDDENFFAAPIFTDLSNGKISMNPYGSDGSPNGDIGGYWANMTVTDLKAWQNFYRNPTNASVTKAFVIAPEPQTPAADVLLALSKLDPAIEELRRDSQRPYSNVPSGGNHELTDVSQLILPPLAQLKRCSQVLRLRIIAELADDQSAKALDDEILFLRLRDSLNNSPYFISHLVSLAIFNLAVEPIYEGLAKHQWSDEQLVELDKKLAKIDWLADYEFAIRGERAYGIALFENQRHTRELISDTDNGNRVTNSLALMPSAYFYQNELNYARMSQQWLLPLVDTNSNIISPEASRHAETAVSVELKYYSPYKIQPLRIIQNLTFAAQKFAYAQTSLDLARVACALERYRLAHGGYPETLDALTPQFTTEIPHDLINGQPLHYRLAADGRFVLYSVGWNEKDDGGTVVLSKNGSVDKKQGDWVWEYPAK